MSWRQSQSRLIRSRTCCCLVTLPARSLSSMLPTTPNGAPSSRRSSSPCCDRRPPRNPSQATCTPTSFRASTSVLRATTSSSCTFARSLAYATDTTTHLGASFMQRQAQVCQWHRMAILLGCSHQHLGTCTYSIEAVSSCCSANAHSRPCALPDPR